MILDEALRVSDAQVVTVDAVSVNSIDLGPVPSKAGPMVRALFSVDVTATAAGDATLKVEIVTSNDPTLATGRISVGRYATIPVANLTAGMLPIVIGVNPDTADEQGLWRRYMGAGFTIATGPLTAGAFTVDFLLDPESFQSGPFTYAGGFTVA